MVCEKSIKLNKYLDKILKVVLILVAVIVPIAIIVCVLFSPEENNPSELSFNEYLISSSQYAIIRSYDLPITTKFADEEVENNYHIVKTKNENTYNVGGTVMIKDGNGILKDYKYIAKIEYLPKTNEYKEISAKIYE